MDKINFVYRTEIEKKVISRGIKLPWELYKWLKELGNDGETSAVHFREITAKVPFKEQKRGKRIYIAQNPTELRRALWAAYARNKAKLKRKAKAS
jgi:hypothetical protein